VEGSGEEVIVDGLTIPMTKKFKYLGLFIKEKGDVDEDANQSIRMGLQIQECFRSIV